MAADIMGVPVKRPVSDEAAAMGGAIQALWCLENVGKIDTPTSIAVLCAEHVALRKDETVTPIAANVAAYDKAYTVYNRYLEALTSLFA
jgi:xylulokinase